MSHKAIGLETKRVHLAWACTFMDDSIHPRSLHLPTKKIVGQRTVPWYMDTTVVLKQTKFTAV